jgi:hypothetical protein
MHTRLRRQQVEAAMHLKQQSKVHELEIEALTCELTSLRQVALQKEAQGISTCAKSEKSVQTISTRRGSALAATNTACGLPMPLVTCQECSTLRATKDQEQQKLHHFHVEELLLMEKSYRASEAQLLRAAQKYRDETRRANRQLEEQKKLIEQQENALKTFRKHESKLLMQLSKASSDELQRTRKLELLEEAGAQLLQLVAEGGGPTCTLYASEPEGPPAGADDESWSGCARKRSESQAASQSLNYRIDKMVALACAQLDMISARGDTATR